MTAIDFYTDRLWRYYEELYTDTGLGNTEEIIKDQYKESSDILHDSIYSGTEKLLSGDKMYGSSFDSTSGIYTITTSIGCRRLFIEYREYPEEHIRVILDVQIIRK